MTSCVHCGAPVAADDRVCPSCGERTTAQAASDEATMPLPPPERAPVRYPTGRLAAIVIAIVVVLVVIFVVVLSR